MLVEFLGFLLEVFVDLYGAQEQEDHLAVLGEVEGLEEFCMVG